MSSRSRSKPMRNASSTGSGEGVGAAPPAARARQASLRRLERFAIEPRRKLGQNFLVDDNLLGVAGRAAELERDDVVLEVGGGLGVLSEYLARRVRFVHVFEVDERLRAPLLDAVAPFANVALHFEDAARADLAALEPAPGKCVANLPYSVAVPVVLRTVVELPRVGLWCVMVQREVADRLAARPGTKAYGAPTAIVRLACEVKFLRPVSRTVFVPQPRVDSALILLRRERPFPYPVLRDFVFACFAHRRKALAKSLAIALADEPKLGGALGIEPTAAKGAARQALVEIGKGEAARAEVLDPAEFEKLAACLGVIAAPGSS